MKILFITLSNIGDCILTLPVLDAVYEKYPQAKITCLVSPRPKEIFINNSRIENIIIFDKHSKLIDKIKLFFSLNKEKFDEVIDLRNSFFGAFLSAKKRSSPFRIIPDKIKHMKQRHLFWADFYKLPVNKNANSLNITFEDNNYIENILQEKKLINHNLIIVSPGSRSQAKCWNRQNYNQLCSQLIKEGYGVILVGDVGDLSVCRYLQDSSVEVLNLCAKTSFGQLAALLKKSKLLVTNDSAVMHLASYLNVPVVAIFGPTDESKYGPWSENSIVVKKNVFCRPCKKANCHFSTLVCLNYIKPQDVLRQVKIILANDGGKSFVKQDQRYRRILISRTDRLGDVVLSTPVIKALREKFPQAYLAMMVSPGAKDIVEGNPYLDEVIIFDKDKKNSIGWRSMFGLAKFLRKKKFDLAIILHPTARMHLLIFLAQIPKRLGYDRKLKFLLTDKIKHLKQLGEKHESEYALDLVRYLEIEPLDKSLFVPISQESEIWVDNLFNQNEIKETDNLLIIHPSASCRSRVWPGERFAQVADKLVQKYNFKVIIVSGVEDVQKAEVVVKNMHTKVLNLTGKTSVSQLASVLKRCKLFISTDSGPMHIASALGVPVVTIFGRKQPGLSPKRWGPLGKSDKYLHKDVGCVQCLAHNCTKEFACLKATTVDDVVSAAVSILK